MERHPSIHLSFGLQKLPQRLAYQIFLVYACEVIRLLVMKNVGALQLRKIWMTQNGSRIAQSERKMTQTSQNS